MIKMDYKTINYKLLKKYYKKLNSELQDLRCKDIGEYFEGTKFTIYDKIRYQELYKKINKINKTLYY